MEIVSVLPSAEDEVNVACFHPFSGGGIVYGTKVCIPLLKGLYLHIFRGDNFDYLGFV